MKMLHIETGRHLYGGALQVYYLIKGLKSYDCRNVLVCPIESKIAKAAQQHAHLYAIPLAGDMDFRFIVHLYRIIRKEKPDLIHIHSRRGADVWGALAAKMANRPVIITRRVDNPEKPIIAQLKYRLCNRVIAISKGIQNVLLKAGVPAEKLVCVHSAVDTDIFSKACDRKWFLREFGLSSGNKIVGVVAQLIERKGHRYLFKAVPGIMARFPDIVFIMFGKGPLKNQLHRIAIEQGLANNIRFAGFRDDLDRILPCLDLLVHPALMEGLGVSLLQAAACGVPIVASRVGGIPEIVHDGLNGYLVAPGAPDELATKIISLLQDPLLIKKIATEGPKFIEKYFSIDKMVRGNFEVYKEILNR